MTRDTKYKPSFPLNVIKQFIRDNAYRLVNPARTDAIKHFGWFEADVKKAILNLKTRDFARSVKHDFDDDVWIDHYEADNLLGYPVYIHFHVTEGKLWIVSFKKNTRGET